MKFDYASISAWVVKNKRTIIIIIIILILLVVIKKHGYRFRKFLNPMSQDNVPTSLGDPAEQGGLSASRKVLLQNTAGDLKTDLDGTSWYPGSHDYEIYTKALGFYDDELIYMGKYYKDYLTDGKEKLSTAIDKDSFAWGDTPNQLMNKLKALGV